MKNLCRFWFFFVISLCVFAAEPSKAATDTGGEKLSSAALFKKLSPGVVLLIGTDSIGSGTIVGEREILTNWHVVDNNDRILVAFKPREEGAPIDPDKYVVGTVIKKAKGKDLALVRVKSIPSYTAPIPLGDVSELEIGADVHAIGHPQGEIWTYTRGVISQLRRNFAWHDGQFGRFKADVIQTQTPINPGNSGGPLISDRGRLLGVNSFKARGAEGLNFAVSLSEISRFLGDDVSKPSTRPNTTAKPDKDGGGPSRTKPEDGKQRKNTGLVFQGRDTENTGYLRVFIPSGGKDEIRTYYYPDDQSSPAFCFRTRGGLTDAIVMDMNRDGKWNYSVLDRDRDGKLESVGLHPDGKINPSSFVSIRDKKAPAKIREALPKRVPEQGPNEAGSPSFDCRRADTLIKQTICGSDRLADLDVTVSALYSRVSQKRPSMKTQIDSGQRDWQQGTENMCVGEDIVPCLENRYKQRIIYLNVLMLQ